MKFLIVLAAFLLLYLIWANNKIVKTHYTVTDKKIPHSFDGFKIAVISDFHNVEYRKDKKETGLVSLIKDEEVDAIMITGDFIDSRKTNFNICLSFTNELKDIAPIYYVAGNHEAVLENFDKYKAALVAEGVIYLENEQVKLFRDDDIITISGVVDPKFVSLENSNDINRSIINKAIDSFDSNPQQYDILLSHRPEHFDLYVEKDCDLVLSGHAHGGQIRLPKIGGLFAPNQGLFPKYSAGKHIDASTCMIISRGLGPSIFPLRINNSPELVVVTLKSVQHI